MQTAEVIGEHTCLKVQLDPRLREQNLGVFEGLTAAEHERLYPEANEVWRSKDPDARVPGGESMRERYELAVSCLEQLAANHPGQRIAVVPMEVSSTRSCDGAWGCPSADRARS